jgi:hypothetical protein
VEFRADRAHRRPAGPLLALPRRGAPRTSCSFDDSLLGSWQLGSWLGLASFFFFFSFSFSFTSTFHVLFLLLLLLLLFLLLVSGQLRAARSQGPEAAVLAAVRPLGPVRRAGCWVGLGVVRGVQLGPWAAGLGGR